MTKLPPAFSSVPVSSVSFASLLFVTVAFAGCVGGQGSSTPGGPNLDLGKDTLAIYGIVIDDELVPIDGATITDTASGKTVLTDVSGKFALGPVETGEHPLTAARDGYQPVSILVQVFDVPVEGIQFLLTAVATNVPYHETIPHTTFVNCSSMNPVGGTPCTAIPDYVLGGNTISPSESFAFRFTIPSPNLADLLFEMVWSDQAFASDMSFKVQTPPGQPATDLSTKYFGMSGGQPLRGWAVANVENPTADDGAIFDAEPNKITYEGMTIWSDNNATIPGVPGYLSGTTFYFNHRTDVWMTYFYNRAGTRDFTALPDE